MPRRPDWDEDSPEHVVNLEQVLRHIRDTSARRPRPSVEDARHWHRMTMKGLKADPSYVGAFRGESGLDDIWVKVGRLSGSDPAQVAGELAAFERKIQAEAAKLDRSIPRGSELNTAQLAEVIELCAWTHAEWVRIHPFANGNGPNGPDLG